MSKSTRHPEVANRYDEPKTVKENKNRRRTETAAVAPNAEKHHSASEQKVHQNAEGRGGRANEGAPTATTIDGRCHHNLGSALCLVAIVPLPVCKPGSRRRPREYGTQE